MSAAEGYRARSVTGATIAGGEVWDCVGRIGGCGVKWGGGMGRNF